MPSFSLVPIWLSGADRFAVALRAIVAACVLSAFLLWMADHASRAASPRSTPLPVVLADTTERDATAGNTTAEDSTVGETTAGDTPATGAPSRDIRQGAPFGILSKPPKVMPAQALSEPAIRVPTDTTEADSVAQAAVDTTIYVPRYVDPLLRRRMRSPFRRTSPFLSPRPDPWANYDVTLDSTSNGYRARRFSDAGLDEPMTIDSTTYRRTRLQSNIASNWRTLAGQRNRRRNAQSGLGVNIVVPGGRQSAFSTIFGKPQVDLRVNGQADIDAGFDYRKSDQQVSITGDASQIDPDFEQNLQLGVTGTIGDKMQIDVDWDTNNQFEYQNQVKLQYTGYEDEIIQSIEAGNVFLETPSSLIRGGQSLFGIKSEFQLGNLRFTTVASQQEGQSQSLSIEGGSETSEFNIKPTDYDDNTHFFLGYYFRNRWDPAHVQPPDIVLANGFERITDIEVWKLRTTANPDEDNVRKAVAMVDLGEPVTLLSQADGFTNETLPNTETLDQYDPADVATLRDGSSPTTPVTYLTAPDNVEQPLSSSDYQVGDFRKLERGRDYAFDGLLGYISLTQRLQDNEALAVAFRYQANGQTVTVGDFASEAGGTSGGQNADRLVLKLVRPANLTQPGASTNPAAWYLQMRNIYRLQGRGFNPDNFTLDIQYEPSGRSPSTTIPELAGQSTLLQVLGLDRLNRDGAPSPDDAFDYLRGYTIDPGEGYLIFPYLEPFGSRIADAIAARDNLSASQQQELEDQFVFRSLYRQKPENARLDQGLNIYRIDGSYKGAVQDFYDLRAFAGLVEGSVEVTAGGTPLQEGVDYTVDYQGGTVTITNQSYLATGRNIEINYEENSFANLQKKTLLGARADYALDDRLALGATVMRLSQQSPIDKFRIGEEPIKNTIWGLDGSLDLEPRWLTRSVDALPLVQTRAPSSLSISGEFAQFRPGHTTTDAFQTTRDSLRGRGRDFSSDELGGISYIDDFEGFENTFSLRQPGSWQLSAPPDSIARVPSDVAGLMDDSLRTTWRGTFAWYQLNQNIVEQLSGKASSFDDEASRILRIDEVFPERDISGEIDRSLTTLDLYFDPQSRGPYNYTTELDEFIRNPKDVWGGFTQRIPEGYTDFNLQNVEFVEFIFKPYPENSQRDAGRDARLYLDLGSISEDVVPNEKLNTEDGISTTGFSERDLDPSWGRLPGGQENSAVDVNGDRTEDLGLDGVVSYNEAPYDPRSTESVRFESFLNALPSSGASLTSTQQTQLQAEVERARRDPSGDDYRYFDDDRYFDDAALFPNGASFQERFSRYYAGQELNSFEGQNRLAQDVSIRRGNARTPDSEDLNFNATIDTENSYFQYSVPLGTTALDSLARPERSEDFIVSEIVAPGGQGTGWYKVRIPVRDFTRRVGSIQDFSLIESIRMWTTGHENPITMRIAELELVGSQWRTSEAVVEDDTLSTPPFTESTLSVSSINNEEDAVYESPTGAIVSQSRTLSGRRQASREQALVLNVSDLEAGHQTAVFKTYSQGLDLLKYSNLRMFLHLNGTLGDGTNLADLPEAEGREKVRVFVRLGASETQDYYEYEQPLTPSRLTSGNPELLWRPETNSMNLVLSALNQLKVARDRDRNAALDSLYWNVEDGTLQPGAPDAEQFAPAGTRLAIKGTPSLQNITTVVIGIRNPALPPEAEGGGMNPANTLQDVTLWVNELRVSGYDEDGGWAALANASMGLADLGRVQANFQRQTDGFGSLSSTLGQRDQQSLLNWSLTTDLNADKLLPERFGWSIPLSMQLQSRTSTPRFAPNRGDVRLSEILSQIDARPDLSNTERATQREAAVQSAQTASLSRSVTARLQKQGSASWLVRNTLDDVSLNYSYSQRDARSPSRELDDSWRWSGAMNYQLDINRPRTVKPLWFLGGAPFIGPLGDLQFNYAPQSVSFSGSAARNVSTQRTRPPTLRADSPDVPNRITYPFREQQTFSHQRRFGLQYNPFEFLNLSFDTNTDQSLNAVGADTLRNIVTVDGQVFNDIDPATFFEENPEFTPDQLGSSIFLEERLALRSEGEIAQGLFSGDLSPRTNQYTQRFTGTLRSTLLNNEAFNWIDLQDVSYQSSFRWQNSALGRRSGAIVSNEANVRSGVTLHPVDLWRKFGFYRSLEESQENDDRGGDRGAAPEDGEEDGEQDGEEDGGPALSELPLPNPLHLLRRALLTVTGIRDFSVTYTGGRGATSYNVGRFTPDSTDVLVDYSLVDAFRGEAPPLGYRFGLDRRIPREQRILSATRQARDNFSNSNQIQARTTLTPSQRFRISLNWDVDWSNGEDVSYRALPDGRFTTFSTENGTNSASVWAFGASYLDLFTQQLQTLRADVDADETADGVLGDENGDGRVVLTNQSITGDFQNEYLSGLGTIGRRGFLPFPMPGWTVNYSGISEWPLISRITQSVTVRHGYTADYNSGYASLTGDSLSTFAFGSQRVQFARPEFSVNSIRINERYQPLVGVDISWLGNFQTNVSWNRTNSYLLSTTNSVVTESLTSELTLTANYRKRGLNIPLLPIGRLNNQISFNLTLARAVNDERRFSMKRALTSALVDAAVEPSQALEGDNVTPVRQTKRLAITPKISYQFSNRVSADFVLRYERFSSENSRRPSYTNVNGGFNVRINVSG